MYGGTYEGMGMAAVRRAPADAARQRLDLLLVRTLNLVLALIALVFFLPLMLLIAAAVFVANPGPIFYAQNRIGYGGRLFRCLKFRTMATDSGARLQHLLATDPAARAEWARDHKLRNDPRIVGIGGFLRKSSLDELPQLINVIRGDMSLVGPRPIVPGEAERYGRYIANYCSVRPGITGLWQISGRNDTTYRRRVAYDVAYSRSRSAMLDLRIMAMTVPSVVLAKGSY